MDELFQRQLNVDFAGGSIAIMPKQRVVALESTGERIRWLRKRARMTQEELGEAIGVGNVFVSNLEKDAAPPPIERLVKIAQIFHTTTDYLLCLSDVPYAAEDEENGPIYFSPEADEAARLIDSMPVWKRKEALHMVRASAAYNEEARRRAVSAAQDIAGQLRFAGAVLGPETVRAITDTLARAWTNAPPAE